MPEKNSTITEILAYITVFFLLLAALFGAIIIGFMFIAMLNISESQIDQSIVSDSISKTYISPFTLNAGNGISSSEVKANNLTYIDTDGIDDFVRITNKTAFEPFIHDNKSSFSIWFKANDWTTGFNTVAQRMILGKDSANSRFYLALGNSTFNNLTFYTTNLGGTSILAIDPDLQDREQWNNVQVVFEGDAMSSYLNGVRKASSNLFSFGDTSDAFLNLGYGRDTYYFNGSIDDFRTTNALIYPAEVVSIYKDNLNGENKVFIPIMMRHAINQTGYQSAEIFEAELDWLNDSGFETITDVEYYNWTQDGGFIMPEKPIMYIFDDGWESVSRYIAPKMDEYGYEGVMSINSVFIGTNDSLFMNWTGINNTLENYRWSIASHSYQHCWMVTESSGGFGINCTDTISRRSNMSEAIINITAMTGVTPITFIHPYNQWNSTTMDDCRLNYSLCFGSSNSFETGVYATKYTNLTNGELQRLNAEDYITTDNFSHIFNYTLNNSYVIKYNINENNGTVANDASGNSNDGTITGATWTTDGLFKTLTAITDYTINPTTGLFTIVNDNYLFSWIIIDWSYDNGVFLEGIRSVSENSLDAIIVYSEGSSNQMNVVTISIILILLIGVFLLFWNRFIKDNISGKSKDMNFGA